MVGMNWLSLLCSIGFITIVAQLFTKIWMNTLQVNDVYRMGGSIIILLLLRVFVTKRSTYYVHKASCEVKDVMRARLYKKILEMKNAYQTYVTTSELVQLNVEGIDQLESYFGRYLPQFFYSMIAPITLFLYLVWMDWKSATVLLICVPLIPLSIVFVQKYAKRLLAKYWVGYASLGDSFLENLQGLTTLKIYEADEYKSKKMKEESENFRRITMRVLTMQLNSVTVMDVIAYGGAAIGSIIAIVDFMNGHISLFAVICITLLSIEFFLPLRLLGTFFHVAMNGLAASEKIYRIIDIPLQRVGKEELDQTEIDLCMEHVCFSYDENREILHDITMTIKPKQFIGIVGESGSGKSTIAKLLGGFAKNYQGSITMQGKQRSMLDDASVYNRFLYVTHKPFITKGSIRDNLKIANASLSDEACWKALEKTCIKEFIEEQGGLDMQLQEDGKNLSGGQKQRLSLARALLADRDIYLFDEATSNIDTESEEAIRKVIYDLARTKTIIMITHRLYNIKGCDTIYVIHEGQCVEQGTHAQLMKQNNHYYNMYQKQKKLENLEGDIAYA